MNWDRVEVNWRLYRGKVRQTWDRLTDEQLDVIAGRRGALAVRLQQVYGFTWDDAERQIRDWERQHLKPDELHRL